MPDSIHHSPDTVRDLIAYLKAFITERRFDKFREVVSMRTRHLTIVLEDIYQPHNASAILRSCDCFGIQDVHIIENRNKYQVNPDVALGSSKWLSLIRYNGQEENTTRCLNALRAQGYRLVATTPHQEDYSPANLPLASKTALIFGTELEGLTPAALEMADDYIRIPMVGFTESLNISVSAAILLQNLAGRLRSSLIPWKLGMDEQEALLLDWLRNSIKDANQLVSSRLSHRP